MMHGSEWTLKYDEREVENVARGHVARTTVLHMFCRMANHWLKIVCRLLRRWRNASEYRLPSKNAH